MSENTSPTQATALRLSASNIGWQKSDDPKVLRRMRELGYTGLEVAPTRIFPHTPYAYRSSAALFSIAIRREMKISISSMQSIWFGLEGNLFDPQAQPDLLHHTRCACRFARAMQCPNLVFGSPRNRNCPEGHDPREADDFFRAAGDLAVEHGVKLALEANPPMYNTNFLNTTGEVIAYVKELGHPGLSVNLDLGAVICNEERLEDIAPDLGLVSHVHISEPGLAPIQRRPIHGELAAMLREGGYQGFVSLEMKTADLETVTGCLEYLAEVFL